MEITINNTRKKITINKNDILNILIDAYNYHSSHYINRLNKTYKQKKKKDLNNQLITFHYDKMNELDEIIKVVNNLTEY